MALNGCLSPSSMAIKVAPSTFMLSSSTLHRLQVHASVTFPNSKYLCTGFRERKLLVLRAGSSLDASGTPLLRGEHGSIMRVMPLLPRNSKVRPRTSMIAAASKTTFPSLTPKPRWWWRTLACVPYLLPLHEAWMYADSVYGLHKFLEKFAFLVDPFLDTLALLPNWFMMVVMYVVYLAVVRKKDMPHFLRFHFVMALLLSLALQAAATISGWMPGMVFKGHMSYLWVAIILTEIFTVLRCMQSSLLGTYADIPFLGDAALTNLRM